MQVTEKEIRRDDGHLIAFIHDGGRINIFDTTPAELDAIAPYIANWKSHGTFTDKPIEWTEAVSGVVWTCGMWSIVLISETDYFVYKSHMRRFNSGSLTGAKSYAEKLIREAK